MGGVGKAVTKTFSNPVRGLTAVATFGTSELARRTPIGEAALSAPEKMLGFGPKPPPAPTLSGESPAAILAQTGGASLLANIALGVDPDEALAGYLGQDPAAFNDYLQTLPLNESNAIQSVRQQLHTIKNNVNLRNQAMTKLIDDFPNLAAQSVQKARQLAQSDLAVFDDVSKKVMDQAANQLSAKFASTGGFSSGAFNEGLAKASVDLAGQRAGLAYDRNAAISQFEANIPIEQYQMRLAETNALREFQQNMLGQVQGQGFNANQMALERNQQVREFNANSEMQQRQIKSQERNAMYGALGSLGGSLLGSWALGRAMGGGAGIAAASSAGAGYNDFATLRRQGMASRPPADFRYKPNYYGPGY